MINNVKNSAFLPRMFIFNTGSLSVTAGHFVPQCKFSMNKFLLLIVLAGLIFSCKSKKTSLSGDDEKVDAHDFVEFFQPLKLPYQVTDTILRRKEAEGAVISYKV